MKPLEPIELSFFHPNSSTLVLVSVRPPAEGSPTVRINFSLRNERGVERWIADRWLATWQKWFDRAAKDRDMNRPLPAGWYPCQVEDVPR